MPIVVVTDARYVVVDGHKRVRCLHRLHRDTVAAVVWNLATCEALIFRHQLQTEATENVFEQAWLLHALHDEHGLALDVVARRFDRSVSWVSRRLSLVHTLPDPIQQQVRAGHIVAHAAMKYLVPLARANADDSVRLAAAIARHRLTTRQIGRLYQHYVAGPAATHDLVLTDPLPILRLTEEAAPARLRPDVSAPEALITNLHKLGAIDGGEIALGSGGPTTRRRAGSDARERHPVHRTRTIPRARVLRSPHGDRMGTPGTRAHPTSAALSAT